MCYSGGKQIRGGMAKQREDDSSWVDMDRLSRIFLWLTAAVVTLLLGMVFDQVLLADATPLASFQQTGVPYTVSYPAGWSAGFDRNHDLVSTSASAVAAASETLLVLNDSPITQVTGVGEGYLVTLGKIRADARAPFEVILADRAAQAISVSGATKAVAKSGVALNTGTETEVVMSVGSDLYVLELMTARGAVDVSQAAAIVLDSLAFTK